MFQNPDFMAKVAALPTAYPEIRLINLLSSYIPQQSFLSFVLNLPALIDPVLGIFSEASTRFC